MASLSKLWNFWRPACKLSNGLSPSFTAVCWFDFLKQLIMVSFDRNFHDNARCFIGWIILIFRSVLLLSTALIQRRVTFFGNGLWCFVFHPAPLVGQQTLYSEAGKSGWCTWCSWFQSEQGNFQKGNPSVLSSNEWVELSYPLYK